MNHFPKILSILLVLLFIGSLSSLRLAGAQTEVYKYIDKNGNVHFTDNAESIPEQYRNQIKILKEPKSSETKASPEGEESPSRKIRDTQEKKKEEEAKALRDREAQIEKQKAAKEIQDRMVELQDQIRAKQQEQASLRTNWMVYDRIRLNQLNEEIASLAKQIESLQQELAQIK